MKIHNFIYVVSSVNSKVCFKRVFKECFLYACLNSTEKCVPAQKSTWPWRGPLLGRGQLV